MAEHLLDASSHVRRACGAGQRDRVKHMHLTLAKSSACCFGDALQHSTRTVKWFLCLTVATCLSFSNKSSACVAFDLETHLHALGKHAGHPLTVSSV